MMSTDTQFYLYTYYLLFIGTSNVQQYRLYRGCREERLLSSNFEPSDWSGGG